MTENYRDMWTSLGLDLAAHDQLLAVLGELYQQIYLGQKNRPKGMAYFDFVISEVHGLRIKELLDAKAKGRKVIGSFCLYVPEEIILAADGVSVGLCAGAAFGVEEAEKHLPRTTCSLIKSFFGFALTRVCPYMAASDLIVGENTCDGKKKSYEIFKGIVDRLYVMDMPQMKSESGRALLRGEYGRFVEKLESVTGRRITAESLKKGIRTVNAKRRAMHRLAKLRAADPAPISGLDALLANQVFFYDDPERFTGSVNQICDELEERVKRGQGVFPKKTARLLVSGCPMAIPNWKLHHIVEASGAVIVGEESCVGERGMQNLVDERGENMDSLLDRITDRYFRIDCAIFTPNPSRAEHAAAMARELKADGVIHYALPFCAPYQIEASPLEQSLEKQGIPVLRIDTDYSPEDTEQIRTRVEAFIERIRG